MHHVSSAAVLDCPVSSLDLSQPWVPASSPISAKQYLPAEAATLSCNAAGYSSDESEGRKRSRQCWEDQSQHDAPLMSATEDQGMSLQVGHLENVWAEGLVSASIVPFCLLQDAQCILICMLGSLLWEHSAGACPSSHLTPFRPSQYMHEWAVLQAATALTLPSRAVSFTATPDITYAHTISRVCCLWLFVAAPTAVECI